MELIRLSDNVYYLPNEEETDRPVLGYINGDKYSLAIDAGNSKNHVEKFYNELRAANLRLPDFTVITHWHWDHTFGMHAVAGKTITCQLTNRKLKEVAVWRWTDDAMRHRLESGQDIEFCDRCIRLEYPNRDMIKVVISDMEFAGELKIDLGGISCELLEFNAPHSEDSVLIYVPEEKVLFVGDADCADYYDNDGKYEKFKLENYIKYIEKLDFDICVLGHDNPERKEKTLNYLKDELGKI